MVHLWDQSKERIKLKYNNKGNFDRVSALLVGMFHMKDLYNKEFEQEMEQSEDSFFNRKFFS